MDGIDKQPGSTRVSIALDYRLIIGLLLLVIAAMLIMWRPWEDARAKDRTIEVTGQSKTLATPDEFVFYPMYQFKNIDKQAALGELTKKSDEIVKKLKELGVADNKIKTNSDGSDYPYYRDDEIAPTYTLRLTATVDNKGLAQKVQDYLVTTSPTGAVSPQATFSEKKRTEIEAKARDEATKNARSKAEQSAKNLGFSLGAVKSVNDGLGFGGIIYPAEATDAKGIPSSSTQQLSIQPGENELTYTVTVSYYVK